MMRIILGGGIGSIAAALIVMAGSSFFFITEKSKPSREVVSNTSVRVKKGQEADMIVSVPRHVPSLATIRVPTSQNEIRLKKKIGWTSLVEQVEGADIIVVARIVNAMVDNTKNEYEIVLETQEVLRGPGGDKPVTIRLRGFANQKYRVLFPGGESEKLELDLQDFPKGATRALLITRRRRDGLVCYSLKTLSSYGEDEIPQIRKIIASRKNRIAQLVTIIRENAAKDEKICWLAGRYLTKKMKAENIEEAVTVLVDLLNKVLKQANAGQDASGSRGRARQRLLHDAIAVLSYSKSGKAHAAVVDVMRSNSEDAQNRRLAAHYSSFFPEAARRKYLADVIEFAEQGQLENGADFAISGYLKNIASKEEKTRLRKKHTKVFQSRLKASRRALNETKAANLQDRLRVSSFILGHLGYPEAADIAKDVMEPAQDKESPPQIEISEEDVLRFLNLKKDSGD